jgi:hypothetical protein
MAILAVVLIILALGVLADWKLNSGISELGVCCIILMLVGTILPIAITSCVILDYQTDLIRVDRDLIVVNERFTSIQKTIESYARKYPIEEPLLRSFNPEILLALPEIKSDSFLLSQINLAVNYQDEIFKLQLEKNKIKQALDWHKNRAVSPTLIYPGYKD